MSERPLLAAPLVLLAAASCSGGSGGSHPGGSSFQLETLSLQQGSVWPINREIVLEFSEPVDFSTVSSNTINIRSVSDVPAIGTFRLLDPRTVVFQPSCPTLEDLSDAGLQPGGVAYVLRVPGSDTSSNTLRSTTGVRLGLQWTRSFTTPASTQPSIVFQDTRSGPPAPVQRPTGTTDRNASHLEVGGDPEASVYFELDAGDELVLSDPSFEAPLNLYSDPTTRIAVILALDQPVDPSASNISPNRLELEFRDSHDAWHAIDTRVTLVANCTETGSSVRLEPIGVLPQTSAIRAVILPGFQDLVGETVLREVFVSPPVPTRSVSFTSLAPADELGDGVHESFDFGGDSPLSFQDTSVIFDSPTAEWGDGRLSAAFSFEGTGGPNGNFDWIIHAGEVVHFDTNSAQIVGGPGGQPTTLVTALNGIVDVRNFTIEEGGEMSAQGPNPLRIRATGNVTIRGRLDVSGFSARDVISFNTGNLREVGGSGAAGGGRGGTGNENISGPTPRGGRGQGPFATGNLGGEGGEMGVSNINSKNARRPGGGGGARFSRDLTGTTMFADLSLKAEAGSDGNARSTGAESRASPAKGGAPGAGAFFDARTDNDYFGVRPLVTDGEITGLVRGELPTLWAGYGGGAGGNAAKVFPNPNWTLSSDEKGGGGGGGGGALHIQALGKIIFGRSGIILSNGGRGATGENTNYLDHIGGTGGGGSGGHIVLETASAVDFTDGGAALDSPSREILIAAGPRREPGPSQNIDNCGQSSFCCPVSCVGNSNGGAGGGGVIQLHVPEPARPPGSVAPANILVPSEALGAPNVLDQISSPPAYVMIPTFGKRSQARSKWISIGGADHRPDGSAGHVRFFFDGIDTTSGHILTNGPNVQQQAPLVAVDDLGHSTTSRILSDGFTLELSGAALDAIREGSTTSISNDVYLRTPALLEGCAVRMRTPDRPANFEDFLIDRAVYDEGVAAPGDEFLRITVGGSRPLTAFNPGGLDGVTGFQLLPRFFQVVTNGLPNSLPETAFVAVRFQAARDNGAGAPDEFNLLQDWTSDLADFNSKPAGALQFFRYEVEFDLAQGSSEITANTQPVTLDFLKIPFVF